MKLPFSRAKSTPTTRREIAARRQAALINEDSSFETAYRRNRNLNTRHTASPVETSERTVQHAKSRRRRTRWIILLSSALVLIVIGLLAWQCTVTVSVQTPDAASAKEANRYHRLIDEYLSARPVERFLFVLNHQSLASFFLEKAPEVKTVRLEADQLARPRLKLTFRQPVVQWTSGDKSYFVDDAGVTFSTIYVSSPSVIVKDQSGVPTAAGQEVINRHFLSFLGQAVAGFREHQLEVTKIILPQNTIRQALLSIKGRPYSIKMTTDREAAAQVAQAVKAMAFFQGSGATPAYIDVRVNQRVFYK